MQTQDRRFAPNAASCLSGMLGTLGRVLTAARYCRRQAVGGALKEKIRKFESSEKNQK
jgi:hypothetical protein